MTNQVQVFRKPSGEIERIRLEGRLDREMSAELERLVSGISTIPRAEGLVVDAKEVSSIDGVVAELVAELVGLARLRGVRVAVVGLKPEIASRIAVVDHAGVLAEVLAPSEEQVSSVLAIEPPEGKQRLAFGVDHYRRTHLPRYAELFKQLAIGQKPHTLFVTCSDSRINPALMTSTDPGELFLVRNVGNMVPAFVQGRTGSAAAAVEYAVGILGVTEVVVCAHSGCGAIHALRNPEAVPAELPSLAGWVRQSEVGELCRLLPADTAQDDVTRINARKQLDNLRSYPVVRERIAAGVLELHAWFFHIGTGEIEQWDAVASKWICVTASGPDSAPPSSRAAKILRRARSAEGPTMIIVEKPSWLKLVFRMHGSAMPRIWRRVLFITVIATAFTRLQRYPQFHYSLSLTPFLLVGLPLGIILGFRNTAAYDRYWEGRKLWGSLVNVSRSFTRQVMTLVVGREGHEAPSGDELAQHHRELCLRTIAFVHAVRFQLRRERTFEELAPLLPKEEIAAFADEPNPAAAILHGTGERLLQARRAGLIEPICYPLLEGSLAQLTDVLGACERIKNTPAPVGYAIFIHRAVAMYCLLLPFGVADAIGTLTPLVAFFVAYAFFSLDAIGDALEDPFKIDEHHLPLTAISRNIEIYIRRRLGETDLPAVVVARDGVLD